MCTRDGFQRHRQHLLHDSSGEWGKSDELTGPPILHFTSVKNGHNSPNPVVRDLLNANAVTPDSTSVCTSPVQFLGYEVTSELCTLKFQTQLLAIPAERMLVHTENGSRLCLWRLKEKNKYQVFLPFPYAPVGCHPHPPTQRELQGFLYRWCCLL